MLLLLFVLKDCLLLIALHHVLRLVLSLFQSVFRTIERFLLVRSEGMSFSVLDLHVFSMSIYGKLLLGSIYGLNVISCLHYLPQSQLSAFGNVSPYCSCMSHPRLDISICLN